MTQLLSKAIHIHAAVRPYSFHGRTAVVSPTTAVLSLTTAVLSLTTAVGHPVGIDLSTGRDSLIGFGGNYPALIVTPVAP